MTDLRGRFVEQIRQNGASLSPELAAAFATVPREFFVADGFLRRDGTWAMPSARDFLDLVYRDDVLVTKVAGTLPVSSSSQPSLMAIMIEALEVRPGMRILEIGAGTGYNAALMSAIGAHVTSVDVQPDVAARARAALEHAGVTNATVLLGDGYQGVPAGHFDRVLVTVGVAGISPRWLSQLTSTPTGLYRPATIAAGDGPAAVGGDLAASGGGQVANGGGPAAADGGPGVSGGGSAVAGGGSAAAADGPAASGGGPAVAGGWFGASQAMVTGGGAAAAEGEPGLSGGAEALPGGGLVAVDGGTVAVGGRRAVPAGGLVVVPVEHAGMHPVLAVRGTAGGPVTATVICPSGFMSAAGPLTADHAHAHPNPAPAGTLERFTQVAAARWDPPLDSLSYRDLWYAAGVWHRRASHASLRRDQSNLALLDEACTGGAIILPSGAILAGGDHAEQYATDAAEILDRWESAGRPSMQAWHITLTLTEAPDTPIWVPTEWSLRQPTTA
jgi:protein-L-isoaspartate(D-aspartate) O-methyltransferase